VEAVARLVFEPRLAFFSSKRLEKQVSHFSDHFYALLHDITLMVVPLLGLGCDQVTKAHCHCYKVGACHLNENRGEDQLAIQMCLLWITCRHAQPIILFTLPQSLKEGSSWAPLETVFKKETFHPSCL
jgi:hypothetical protein